MTEMSLQEFFKRVTPFIKGLSTVDSLTGGEALSEHQRFMYAYYPRACGHNPREIIESAFRATQMLSERLMPEQKDVFSKWAAAHLQAHRPSQLARVTDGFSDKIAQRVESGEAPAALQEIADYESIWFQLRTALAPALERKPKQKFALSPMCEVRRYTIDVATLFKQARQEDGAFPDEAPAKETIYLLYRHRDDDRPRRMKPSMPQLLFLGLLTGEANAAALREAGMTHNHIVAAESSLYAKGVLWDAP